jgi:hypothetical protein
MAVASRQGLIDYCLRSLGEPVVETNLDEQQIEDRIDEAIEHYRLYHYDGIEKVYLKHQVTAEDVTNGWIPVPDYIYGVTRVFPVAAGTGTSKSMFNLQYQLRLNDLYDLTSVSVIYYQQVMNHLALLDHTLNGNPLYRFNRRTGKLYIDDAWQENIPEGSYVLVECYRALDPVTYTSVYGDAWLKHYSTALLKKQWATNIKKFSGLQLPGGVTIDGDKLYAEAIQEMKELEDTIERKAAPLEFFLG